MTTRTKNLLTLIIFLIGMLVIAVSAKGQTPELPIRQDEVEIGIAFSLYGEPVIRIEKPGPRLLGLKHGKWVARERPCQHNRRSSARQRAQQRGRTIK